MPRRLMPAPQRRVMPRALRVRMPTAVSTALAHLANITERPEPWLVTQALRRLFRQLEQGAVSPSAIPARGAWGDLRVDPYEYRCAPELAAWIRALSVRHRTTTSAVIRFAVVRWLALPVCTAILRDSAAYVDPLADVGPSEPPF